MVLADLLYLTPEIQRITTLVPKFRTEIVLVLNL
jgi:hypothetical protein